MLWLIRKYQRYISPFLRPQCRFSPSCSEYVHQSIDKFGYGRGLVLALVRILRCHPWGGCGVDEVPERFLWSKVFERRAEEGNRV
jgi:uncharacterized protein